MDRRRIKPFGHNPSSLRSVLKEFELWDFPPTLVPKGFRPVVRLNGPNARTNMALRSPRMSALALGSNPCRLGVKEYVRAVGCQQRKHFVLPRQPTRGPNMSDQTRKPTTIDPSQAESLLYPMAAFLSASGWDKKDAARSLSRAFDHFRDAPGQRQFKHIGNPTRYADIIALWS